MFRGRSHNCLTIVAAIFIAATFFVSCNMAKPDWISLNKSSGSNDAVIDVTCDKTDIFTDRFGELIVSSDTITKSIQILQNGAYLDYIIGFKTVDVSNAYFMLSSTEITPNPLYITSSTPGSQDPQVFIDAFEIGDVSDIYIRYNPHSKPNRIAHLELYVEGSPIIPDTSKTENLISLVELFGQIDIKPLSGEQISISSYMGDWKALCVDISSYATSEQQLFTLNLMEYFGATSSERNELKALETNYFKILI